MTIFSLKYNPLSIVQCSVGAFMRKIDYAPTEHRQKIVRILTGAWNCGSSNPIRGVAIRKILPFVKQN